MEIRKTSPALKIIHSKNAVEVLISNWMARKFDFQVNYVEPLILDLNKTAINIYGLIKVQDSSLIHFVSMRAKNEYLLSTCKLTGPGRKSAM